MIDEDRLYEQLDNDPDLTDEEKRAEYRAALDAETAEEDWREQQ